jgi:hypothetical protein
MKQYLLGNLKLRRNDINTSVGVGTFIPRKGNLVEVV